MTRDEITALISRREQDWRRHNAAGLMADYAADAVAESPMQGRLEGHDRIQGVFDLWFTAFPDSVFATTDLIVDGNRVVQLFTITGTQTGAFGAVPATGRKFHINGVSLFTFREDGKITHDRRVYDVTNMLVQIGALRAKPVE